MAQTDLLQKSFKDEHNKWAVVSWPNIPLCGWLIFKALNYLQLPSDLQHGFAFVSTAFLFTWAYLELTSGVNYFRRALGAFVLLLITYAQFK